MTRRPTFIEKRGSFRVGRFEAMASPCEVLIDGAPRREAERLIDLAFREARRIERTFSRYRDDNVVHRINTSAGCPVDVDAETTRLLDFADQCFRLSDGRFDITSGVLRRAWTFDGGAAIPDVADIEALLPLVGWQHVDWQAPRLSMPTGMQIDFGGIGKEYAVDRVLGLLRQRSEWPLLVNFGGDLHASDAPRCAEAWQVGIEAAYATRPEHLRPGSRWSGEVSEGDQVSNGSRVREGGQGADRVSTPEQNDRAVTTLALRRGALATSGDARRYVVRDGRRYGHVLDPRTGWPVENAARSITVAADSCAQAGMLSTFALLAGADAEALLDEAGVAYWCQRDVPE